MIIAVVVAIIRDKKTIPVTSKEFIKYSKKTLLKIKIKRVVSKLKNVIKYILRYKR